MSSTVAAIQIHGKRPKFWLRSLYEPVFFHNPILAPELPHLDNNLNFFSSLLQLSTHSRSFFEVRPLGCPSVPLAECHQRLRRNDSRSCCCPRHGCSVPRESGAEDTVKLNNSVTVGGRFEFPWKKNSTEISGWWFFALSLWKIWGIVSWDDFPFPTEWKIKVMFHSSHHQPDILLFQLLTID